MTAPAALRVLIVDDEAIIRRGVRLILESSDGIEVAGEASDGRDAIAQASTLRPDVVLLDLRMPGMDGLSALPDLVRAGCRVLVLTTFDLDQNVYEAFARGASGFLLKTGHPDDLVHAVHVVARGDALVEPAVSRRLIERFVAADSEQPAPRWATRLSEREREVLGLMVLGLSNAEIASRLFVGEATVKTHVTRVLAKIGVRDRLQAVVAAYRSGWAT